MGEEGIWAQMFKDSVEVCLATQRVRVVKVKKMRLNHEMLDIAGCSNQCEPETCKELEELFDRRRRMNVRRWASTYKYALDVSSHLDFDPLFIRLFC